VSKFAAAAAALTCLILFSLPMSAQIIPHGNLYVGGSWAKADFVIRRDTYKGWNASVEAIPFARFSYVGLVFDGSGLYRPGITQYNILGGPRLSARFGKWRPFVHVLGGIQKINSSGNAYSPTAIDAGGGADYKLFFRNFSWRIQADYVHSRLLSASQNQIRASTGIVFRF
jgi:hypothetical protein